MSTEKKLNERMPGIRKLTGTALKPQPKTAPKPGAKKDPAPPAGN